MKLNINAKELLALYNVLYERFDGSAGGTVYKEDDSRATDDTQLKQIYNRLKAIIVAGLTNPNKSLDPVDSWLKHETAKIDDLKQQNESLRETAKNPENFVPSANSILTDDDDEIPGDLPYPKARKGPPGPNMPHPGKHRGRRK